MFIGYRLGNTLHITLALASLALVASLRLPCGFLTPPLAIARGGERLRPKGRTLFVGYRVEIVLPFAYGLHRGRVSPRLGRGSVPDSVPPS